MKFIQFNKNSLHPSGIDRCPYKILFCYKATVGLVSSFPADTLPEITIEEDLIVQEMSLVMISNFRQQSQPRLRIYWK